MAYEFSNKVIWITGASSGIGEALAYAFSARGSRLILSSRRADELERVRQACVHPDRVKVIPMDLLDMGLFAVRTAEAIAVFGQIDMVVHNGGVSQRGMAADRAAAQILRAVRRGKYEAYIGKMGPERMALWVNRWFPGVLIRMAPGLVPK